MALAYAAQDPTIRRVVSCAGNDHAEFIRETQRNAELAREFQVWHRQSMAPQGPVRFHFETDMQELAEHQDVYGLRENAERLSDRSILICGGWEDPFVTVDQYLLPFYRALKKAGAQDVRFLVYHTDHRFDGVRELVADEIANWVLKAHHAAAAQSPLAE